MTFLLLVGCVNGTQADPSENGSFGALLSKSEHVFFSAGASYAVYRRGEIIEAGAFGVADLKTWRKMTAGTPLRIASLTKPVAASLILEAAQAGSIDLGSSFWEHAPQFTRDCARYKEFFKQKKLRYLNGVTCGDPKITIRSVLTHTASAPINTRFAYNGFLFGKLVEVLNAVNDGKSAEEIFRHQIIVAIGLDRSAAGVSDPGGADVIEALAPPHRLDQENQPVPQRLLEHPINTGAGFIASAPDAARVYITMMNGEFLYEGLANDLMKKVVLKNGALSPYRYGVFVEDLRGRTLVWHRGWQPGNYTSLWIHDVDSQTGMVFLSNTDLQPVTGDFSGHTLADNGLANLFLRWQSASADNRYR
ncbi:serine hydrolase [Labrenzia sp. PHM005]|uniref:serine hydrolase domain-containing protein n=1 Tax=Labrenzia sp. PHM005 TaxID=2590016 RepID=UPI00143D1879|nr:serine hydrolase domain-containing protein [Labrenzia sp. PHM005]